jgi:DNA/RNA-binding domain of Phe-tRNA-synthetase-like protein
LAVLEDKMLSETVKYLTPAYACLGSAGNVEIDVKWDSVVSTMFRKLALCVGTMSGVCVEKDNEHIQQLRRDVYGQMRAKYAVETLKDNPTVRAYRDFYWKLGIDPTKTRPSGEALLRRVLNGNELPIISTAVDAYNLASMKTIIPISGFDGDRLEPPFQVRFARNDEVFAGIGMAKPVPLMDKMLVLTDEKRVLCIYPYRDCGCTKIGLQTQNVVIVAYGTPEIAEEQLKEAVNTTLANIKQVSGGEIEMTKVFSSALK